MEASSQLNSRAAAFVQYDTLPDNENGGRSDCVHTGVSLWSSFDPDRKGIHPPIPVGYTLIPFTSNDTTPIWGCMWVYGGMLDIDTDGEIPTGFDEDVMEVVYVWYVG